MSHPGNKISLTHNTLKHKIEQNDINNTLPLIDRLCPSTHH